ncbi:uncharacterized protein LOC123441633 [Hordeum vulgare subsp. vulgare]|uniref:uncharacterized protein LOC123441633 n=1 Tax=Hordeum vulgare subsp. vulgare TaxID=112509 RepID=UPI001D1A5888|nr:uncharacterized protein LOC123441633 [Hordeum vulgare subsp. vulgare]
MTASSSSSLRIPAPTHHPAAGARPLWLPFHSVSVRPRRSPVSASPQQASGPGNGDRANGLTGVPVPVPFSCDAAMALPHKAGRDLSGLSVRVWPLTSADLMGEANGEGLKVAYQGCPGAYNEVAAKKAYPSYETVPCEYFETAFQDLQQKRFRCQRQRIKLPEQLSIPNLGSSVPDVPIAISTTAAAVSVSANTISSLGPVRPIIPAAAPTIFAAFAAVRNAPESTRAVTSTPANLSTAVKDDESMSFLPRRPSPAVTEISLGRGITHGLTSQALAAPISVGRVPGNGSITAIPAINDLSKRNISNTYERVNSGGLSQQLVSPLGSKIQQQPVLKTNDAVSSDSSNTSESAVLGGRVFSPPIVPGAQWRAQTPAGLQNQSETGQFHERPEVTDQREKYLQRLQQVQQQQGNHLNASHITSINEKQFPTQQPNSLLQQFNSQSSSISSQGGLGLGVHGAGIPYAFSSQLQPHESQILEQYAGQTKSDEQQGLADDAGVESAATTRPIKDTNEDDMKAHYLKTDHV